MTAVLERFETEHQRYHGLSDERLREQQEEVRRLANHAQKTPQECQAGDLRAYLASLDHLHPNTVRKRLRLLTPFFVWGFENGLVSAEQLMAIKLVRAPKGSSSNSRPRPYSPKELRQFWVDLDATWPMPDRLDYYLGRYQKGRSRYAKVGNAALRLQADAVFTLALECGMRRIEIFSAEIDHIHPDNACVIVPQRGETANGKDHYREIPHTEASRASLTAWLELRTRLGVKHDRPWIIGAINQPKEHALSPISFESFKNIPTQVGNYEYHRFRHTAATLWLRSGVAIEQVQKMLGHATLQQTLAYAEIMTDDIRDAVAKNETAFAQLTRRNR